jgi:hypothetical protein
MISEPWHNFQDDCELDNIPKNNSEAEVDRPISVRIALD